MIQKSTLEKHIDTLNKKKLISLPDLIKLNNYNKSANKLEIGKYATFQYNHRDKKNVFNSLPFILVTNYSPYHVSGINLLHLNIPLRAKLFDVVEKNNDVNLLHHHLHHLSNTHYLPYFQTFSFKQFTSHILTFDKEHHSLLNKLPIVPILNNTVTDNKKRKYSSHMNISKVM